MVSVFTLTCFRGGSRQPEITQEQDLRQKKNIPSKWLKLYKRCEVDWDELLDLPAIYNPLLGICNNC